MAHFIEICQYGQQHSTCRCPSPAKAVREVACNSVKAHKARQDAAVAAEINHETTVETNLYRLETFSARHKVPTTAARELTRIVTELRKALDCEPPNGVA